MRTLALLFAVGFLSPAWAVRQQNGSAQRSPTPIPPLVLSAPTRAPSSQATERDGQATDRSQQASETKSQLMAEIAQNNGTVEEFHREGYSIEDMCDDHLFFDNGHVYRLSSPTPTSIKIALAMCVIAAKATIDSLKKENEALRNKNDRLDRENGEILDGWKEAINGWSEALSIAPERTPLVWRDLFQRQRKQFDCVTTSSTNLGSTSSYTDCTEK